MPLTAQQKLTFATYPKIYKICGKQFPSAGAYFYVCAVDSSKGHNYGDCKEDPGHRLAGYIFTCDPPENSAIFSKTSIMALIALLVTAWYWKINESYKKTIQFISVNQNQWQILKSNENQ